MSQFKQPFIQGKTTTMDIISGLLSVDSGSVSALGYPVSPFSSGYKKALGYCPQENIFYTSLTVFENLLIVGILKGSSFSSLKKKIPILAEQFDLRSKLNEQASNLSGGMKRRLCLAMAIIGYCDVSRIKTLSSSLDF